MQGLGGDLGALVLLLGAAAGARQLRLGAVSWACCFVAGALALTASTLKRSETWQAQEAQHLLAELAWLAGAAACAALICFGLTRRAQSFEGSAALGLRCAAAALPLLLIGTGLLPARAVRVQRRASVALADISADLWVHTIRSRLHAAAAGQAEQDLAAALLAANHGADVATLRALCPTRPGAPGAKRDAGLQLCRAVCAPLPEAGARSLACGAPASGDQAAQHRCRLAAELYAAAGDLEAAEQAAEAAGAAGGGAVQALWRARQLPLPVALQQAGEPFWAWPDPSTISPEGLGFALQRVPGQLIWHPGPPDAPAPRGVISARSRYRSVLTTTVPVPKPRPLGARLTIFGQPGLAITFAGAAGVQTYRCADDPGSGLAPLRLPKAACQERWVELTLTPAVGEAGIESAFISGEFLLARWQWQPHEAQP